jgi:hypothetical protein
LRLLGGWRTSVFINGRCGHDKHGALDCRSIRSRRQLTSPYIGQVHLRPVALFCLTHSAEAGAAAIASVIMAAKALHSINSVFQV